VAGSKTHFLAGTVMLAAVLLFGGAGAGRANADDADSGADASGAAAEISKADETPGDSNDGAGSKPDTPHPTSTVGNGRDGGEPVKTARVDAKKPDDEPGRPAPKPNQNLTIPILRWPTPEEVSRSGAGAFVTTYEVRLGDFFPAWQPTPAPAPGPAFRTREPPQAPPVVDAGGERGPGDHVGVATAAPPVLAVPVVAAPVGAPMPRVAPRAPAGPSAVPNAPTAVARPDYAVPGFTRGATSVPVIPRSPPPSAGLPAGTLTPVTGQATRVAYPRYFRNPTVAELTALALPGMAGLLFVTFGGGLIGYRQASGTRFIRTPDAARFLR
jgi:hypothetical protein